jgi:3-hydroxybutyryl-CoA dehydrogenase
LAFDTVSGPPEGEIRAMTNAKPPICVVGAGTMGRGIAQVALAAGHEVWLVDPDAGQLVAAETEIRKRLARKRPDAGQVVDSDLHTATSLTDTTADPDTVVVEAVVERLDVKQRVFNQALDHFGPNVILATNTSSLSITEIAAGAALPSRVVGMHFFNPVPAMRLVEVVTGLQTEPEVAELIGELATAWGKDVTKVRSAPGFIVNRVARPFYGEALKLLEEGAAPAETIDEVLRSAGAFRMGPFELIDLIGCEVNFAVTQTVWAAYNYDPRFAPSQIQRELVAAKRFGRKSGHGFYRYDGDAVRVIPEPARSSISCPTAVVLHGHCEQLEALLRRSGVDVSRKATFAPPAIEIPGLGIVQTTSGRTAQEGAADRGCDVALIDRCLDPETATALAFSSTASALSDALTALLDRAGVRGYAVTDTPGLIVARIVAMIINEACETALHGVATPGDIDTAMMLGTNYPLGPFEWCDKWSAASTVELLDNLWVEYHDTRYRTSVKLRALARSSKSSAAQPTGVRVSLTQSR